MEETKKSEEVQKPSYEALMNQVEVLYRRMQQMDMTNIFKRMDYLFKVVENSKVFSQEFVKTCIEEITNLLTIEEEPAENKK